MGEINKPPLPDLKKKTATGIPGGRIQPPINVSGNPIAEAKAGLAAKHHDPHRPIDRALKEILDGSKK